MNKQINQAVNAINQMIHGNLSVNIDIIIGVVVPLGHDYRSKQDKYNDSNQSQDSGFQSMQQAFSFKGLDDASQATGIQKMIDALRYRVDFGLFMNDQSYYAVREASFSPKNRMRYDEALIVQNTGGNTQKVDYLTQTVNGKDLYPKDCVYFSDINAFLMAGHIPIIDVPDLAQYVHNEVSASNYTYSHEQLIKDVFGLDVTKNDISTGLSSNKLSSTIGKSPAVLFYDQAKFWGIESLNGSHGVSFYDNTFRDPYLGNSGGFNSIIGPRTDAVSTEYTGGYYFTW